MEEGKWAQQVADRSQQDIKVVHEIGRQEGRTLKGHYVRDIMKGQTCFLFYVHSQAVYLLPL